MQTITTNTTANLATPAVQHTFLMLDSYSAIQSYACNDCQEGALFLEENILIFVTAGSLKIRYGKVAYEIGKNQMVFLKKDILIEYQLECHPDNPVKIEYIVFVLGHELVKEFTKLAELPITPKEEGSPVTVNMPGKRLTRYIESLEPYFISPEKTGASLIKIKLLELLFYLASESNNILEQVLDIREHFRSNITVTVEDNIMNSLSLNQLAVLSGRSLSSFRRDFLAIYNMPPSQWIRQKRLEKAQELLLGTTMTVTDICYTLGFENIAHFSRLFKSQFGYPPSEFRMNILVA